MTRIFSDEELDLLARRPRDQIEDAVARSPGEALETFERWVRRHTAFTEGFYRWVATIQGWLYERHGPEGLATTADLDSRLAHASPGSSARDGDLEALCEAVREVLGESTRTGAVLARWDAVESHLRTVHDHHRDRVSAYLSHVYRSHGVDELETCLRYSGERTLLRWMPEDLSRPPEVRLRTWVGMLHGNFARIRIEEDDEKFTIIQDPCGTCTRQIEAGACGPPLDLAVVAERHRITYGEGDMPVYRTHVAVMHYLMPIEKSGVPWPVVSCPMGRGTGPCQIALYKDPARTPESLAARVA